MELRKQIEQFQPGNEQEQKDQEMILNYFDTFDDILTRKNEIVHFTSSGFVLNETRDKVLMVYHNIYQSWAWTGGHADGEQDLLQVAIREVQEETGAKHVKPITEEIIALDVLPVIGHVKRGKYVTAHLHISVAYLLEVSEQEEIHIKADENSQVGWLPLDTFLNEVKEEHMKPIYQKVITRARQYH